MAAVQRVAAASGAGFASLFRGILAHPGQFVCGLTLLAFAGAVAAAPLSPALPPSHTPWDAALRSADASLLAAATAGAGLGLALVGGSTLTLSRRRGRRSPRSFPQAAGPPFDAEAAVRRAVERITPPDPAAGVVEELTRRMTSLFAATDIEKRAAAALLDAGDVAAAATQLDAVARRQDEVFGRHSRMAGRTWREVAALCLASNETQAVEAYRRGGRRDPHDYWGQLFLARLAYTLGYDHRTARVAADDAVRTAASVEDRVIALSLLGDVAKRAGDLVASRGAYESALDFCRQRAASAPGDTARLSDVALLYERLGEVEDAAWAPVKALWRYRESLAITARQVIGDPEDPHWRRGFLVAHRRIAELEAALAS